MFLGHGKLCSVPAHSCGSFSFLFFPAAIGCEGAALGLLSLRSSHHTWGGRVWGGSVPALVVSSTQDRHCCGAVNPPHPLQVMQSHACSAGRVWLQCFLTKDVPGGSACSLPLLSAVCCCFFTTAAVQPQHAGAQRQLCPCTALLRCVCRALGVLSAPTQLWGLRGGFR